MIEMMKWTNKAETVYGDNLKIVERIELISPVLLDAVYWASDTPVA